MAPLAGSALDELGEGGTSRPGLVWRARLTYLMKNAGAAKLLEAVRRILSG